MEDAQENEKDNTHVLVHLWCQSKRRIKQVCRVLIFGRTAKMASTTHGIQLNTQRMLSAMFHILYAG